MNIHLASSKPEAVVAKRPSSVGPAVDEAMSQAQAKKQRTINLDDAIELSTSVVDDELSSEDILEHQSISPIVQSGHMDLNELAFTPTRLTESYLANWLTEHEFIKFLFSPGYLHTELLRRCGKICCFLAEQQRLTTKEIDLLWEIASAKSGVGVHESVKDSCYSILEDICGKLYHDVQKHLWHKVKDIPHCAHDERTIAFLRKYILHTADVAPPDKQEEAEGSNGSVKRNGEELILLWDLAVNTRGEDIVPQVRMRSLEYLRELIVCPVFADIQGDILQKCLDNLAVARAIPQSYSIFRSIVSRTPSFDKLKPALTMKPIRFAIGSPPNSHELSKAPPEEADDFEEVLLDAVVKELEHYCVLAKGKRKGVCPTTENYGQGDIREADVVELSISQEEPGEESLCLLRQMQRRAQMETAESAECVQFLRDLNSRLNFISFLIREGVVSGMKLAAVECIWQNTVLSELYGAGADAVMVWLRDAHQEIRGLFCKEDNIPRHLLTSLLPQLQLSKLRPSAFLFFKYFFFLVNAEEKRLVRSKSTVRVETSHPGPQLQPLKVEEQIVLSVRTIALRGFGLLWSMALESRDHSVSLNVVFTFV